MKQLKPEAKARYLAQSRDLWAKYKTREEVLRATGMQYADILKDEELDTAMRRARHHDNTCPECGGTESHVENYGMMWHDGDLVCLGCDTRIRGWDAG